jgi:hypothetical protein
MRPFRHAVMSAAASRFARDRAQHSEAAGIHQRYSANLAEEAFSEVRGIKLGRSGRALGNWTGAKRYSRTSPYGSSRKSGCRILDKSARWRWKEG